MPPDKVSNSVQGIDLPFFRVLRRARARAGLSQMALALEAGMSQRHVSFLETGRAQPRRDTILRLAGALQLSPQETDACLAAAGFAPARRDRSRDPTPPAEMQAAARRILALQTRTPAALVDIDGAIIATNSAFDRALAALGDPDRLWRDSHGDQPRNLYRLSLHPRGLAQHLVNLGEVAAATLRRVAREAQEAPRLRALLAEVLTWPGMNPGWLDPPGGAPAGPILVERYRVGGAIVGVIASITTIGAPVDAIDGGLRLESYFPADPSSSDTLNGLLGDAGPRWTA